MAENHYYNFIRVEHELSIILVRICRYKSSLAREGGEAPIQHWCPPDMIPFGWGHFNTNPSKNTPGQAKHVEEKLKVKSANKVNVHN